MEKLSQTFKDSINEIKTIFENINKSKEDLKLKVLKIFTKIRSQINEREDEIMNKIDTKFDTLFFKEDNIKEFDKLPNKIKTSLEKGKKIDNNWNSKDIPINSLINDCINIENSIKYINDLNGIMRKCRSLNLNANFYPQENEIVVFLKTIKCFGKLSFNNFKFMKCPQKISKNREY